MASAFHEVRIGHQYPSPSVGSLSQRFPRVPVGIELCITIAMTVMLGMTWLPRRAPAENG
jgi:hypothetical protein